MPDATGIFPKSSWLPVTRPGFVQYVRSAYWLGGYEVFPSVGIDLDEHGLEWVRTITLRNLKIGIEYRMIEPEDMPCIVGPYPSDDLVRAMYGNPVLYENYQEWRKDYA